MIWAPEGGSALQPPTARSPARQAFRVSICASLFPRRLMKDQRWSTAPAGSCHRPSHRRYVGRFGEIRGALAGLLHPFRLRVRRPRPSSRATKQREDHRVTDAVGDHADRDACRGHGLSVEDAEVAPLGKAGYDRFLVPSEPGLGWRGSGPNRRDGPRQRPGLHPGDIRSEMISGWVSIPAPAVRSYRRRDP